VRDDAIEIPDHCPACGKPALTPWRPATPGSGMSPDVAYRLLRCSRCGSAALVGGEDDRALYESGTYKPSQSSFDGPLEWLRRLALRDRLRLLGGVERTNRVLEVGAGRGGLLALLAQQGGDVIGIEPSRASWAAAHERGLRVAKVSIEEAEVEPRSRDVVILWHVLEHLDRPADALERVRTWIAEGGRRVIAVPNLRSLQARLGGDRWFHQDVPRHRTQFTVEGLGHLLRRTGFVPVRTRQAVIDQGLLGMWLTLLNRLTVAENVPFRFLKRDLHYSSRAQAALDAAITLVLGLPLVVLAVPLEVGAAIARRGGSVVVQARPAGRIR
jgi:SAM-dependent methyltransferase